MAVPVFAEPIAVGLNVVEKQHVKQPEMVGVAVVKVVQPLKMCEECSPASRKVPATFQPEPFNTGVVGRPVNQVCCYTWRKNKKNW